MRRRIVSTYQPPIYDPDQTGDWKSHLDSEGFVVLRNAISEDKAKEATANFMDEIHTISPGFKPDDKTTWTSANYPGVYGKGSIVFKGMAQSTSNWILRIYSIAMMAFAMVYGVGKDQLAVSFDGMSLFVDKKQQSEPWPHQDQKSSDKRLSIQGILNLLPCGHGDAGFVCVPKSHLEYTAPDQKTDWVLTPKDHPILEKLVKLVIPEPRTLILFNSKLIHANTGMSGSHHVGQSLNRLSAYITFVPRERQTEEIRRKRLERYHSGNCTSHWADRHEEKKAPFHIASKLKTFNHLTPKVEEDGSIPKERLALI